jgi:hypothetical protein
MELMDQDSLLQVAERMNDSVLLSEGLTYRNMSPLEESYFFITFIGSHSKGTWSSIYIKAKPAG